MGILSICFYYAWKNIFIYLTYAELSKIFSISKEIISSGNKRINKALMIYPELRVVINIKPICLNQYIKTIKYKFPILNKSKDINFIYKVIMRLNDHLLSIKNVPKSIISGIIWNYVKKNEITEITKVDIINGFGCSTSIVDTYSKKINLFMDNSDESILIY
jgi:hypothetical protein